MIINQKVGWMGAVLLALAICVPSELDAQRVYTRTYGLRGGQKSTVVWPLTQSRPQSRYQSQPQSQSQASQEPQTLSRPQTGKGDVQLTVVADGATKDEAIQSALRGAIEQAFGVFVSSHTEILNDELVKDEIATVASGNIKSFECLSENCVDNRWLVSVRAVVSTDNLVRYTESKGSSAELAGSTFAMNVRLFELYRKNEELAVRHLVKQLAEMAGNMFDFKIVTEDFKKSNNKYMCNFTVKAIANATAEKMYQMLINTLASLSMTKEEYDRCKESGFSAYELFLSTSDYRRIQLECHSIRKTMENKAPLVNYSPRYSGTNFFSMIYLRNNIQTLLAQLENWILVNAMRYRLTDNFGEYTTKYVNDKNARLNGDNVSVYCQKEFKMYGNQLILEDSKLFFNLAGDHIKLKQIGFPKGRGGTYSNNKHTAFGLLFHPSRGFSIDSSGYMYFDDLNTIAKLTNISVVKATPDITFEELNKTNGI